MAIIARLRPTIYDIAKRAKVGIGTVSRVLNNHPSVAKKTRTRVLDAVSRLNYQPHPYARGLARKRTNSLMVVVPYFTTPFFLEILQGVHSKLTGLDYDLILYGVSHPDHLEQSLARNVFRNRVDGILFISMKMPKSFAERCRDQNIPVVLVDSHHTQFDSLSVDNIQGVTIATTHLISLGHRQIGILNANLKSTPAHDRLEGFQRALFSAGIDPDSQLQKSTLSTDLDGFTQECGYELMQEFLALGPRKPTAIFVSSDVQAIGALRALSEKGIRCPEDVAIVGFDDIELAGPLGLTTMHQPMREMGTFAADILLGRVEEDSFKLIQKSFIPELVIRRTCGASLKQRGSSKADVA